MIHLVLGFARSGKSRFAEQQFANTNRVHYVATAQAFDNEMLARINHHQQSRNDQWQTIEAPVYLASALADLRGQRVLVDCLTVWLSNLLHHQQLSELPRLLEELTHWQSNGELILVSNEVGGGIVPLGELTRRYVDEHGRMNQQVAALANKVHWVIAGIPTQLK